MCFTGKCPFETYLPLEADCRCDAPKEAPCYMDYHPDAGWTEKEWLEHLESFKNKGEC